MQRSLAVLFFCVSTTIAASENAALPNIMSMNLCAEIERTAGEMMRVYQTTNATLTRMLATVDKVTGHDPYLQNIFRTITIEAWAAPKYETAEMQNAAIVDYTNEVAVKCYREVPTTQP